MKQEWGVLKNTPAFTHGRINSRGRWRVIGGVDMSDLNETEFYQARDMAAASITLVGLAETRVR